MPGPHIWFVPAPAPICISSFIGDASARCSKSNPTPSKAKGGRTMTVAIALLFVPAAKLLARLKRAIETELAIRQAISELNEMNDHMLRDIGLTHGEIEHAVRGPGARRGMDGGSFGGDEAAYPDALVRRRRPDDVAGRSLPSRVAA
jgi:uncharacterized protein YjiS (DUF1127 family)